MASLIKTIGGKKPSRAVQFTDVDGDRRTVRLGKVGLEPARRFKTKLEALLSSRITGSSPDVETSAWLAGLSDIMHAKLAGVGLVDPREPAPVAPTLGAWLDKYIGQREGELKPSSVKKLARTKALLLAHFDTALPIDAITPDAAADWRAWLAKADATTEKAELSEATVRLHCRNAKTIFNDAAERELLKASPFRKLTSRAIAAERDRYITPDEAAAILGACPDVRWQVLFGLARYAGLRVPSETHILTWADVDWERGRLSVHSPKTERYEKHRRRSVPITPELATILQDAFDAAEDGAQLVVGLSRNNLHRTMETIVKRAEVEAFGRCFQVLRQSRETEWAMRFPQHAVSKWLGHSERVSVEHYLQVPDDIYDRAAGRIADSDDSDTSKSAAECAAATSRIAPQGAADGASDSIETPLENPIFIEENAENGTGPGGIRTHDQAIMSRLL